MFLNKKVQISKVQILGFKGFKKIGEIVYRS